MDEIRRMAFAGIIGLVSIGFVSVSCDGSDRASGGSTEPVPIDDLINQIISAECTRLVRCSDASDSASCAAFQELTNIRVGAFNSPNAIVAAVKAGKIAYDGAAARTCLDKWFGAGSCVFDSFSSMPVDCERAFSGKVADGGRCIADVECRATSFCASPVVIGFGRPCDGICTPGGTLCNDDTDCGNGQVCGLSISSMGTSTSQGTCVTPVPAGRENQACGTNLRCQSGLYCLQSGPSSICTTLPQAGQPCPHGFCAEGLICTYGNDYLSTTCLAPAAKGEPCQARLQCGGMYSSLICDDTVHLCVDRPTSGSCPFGFAGCNIFSSYCDTTHATPTCLPYGATCNTASEGCALGMTCEATSSAQPIQSQGGTCVAEGMALASLACTP